METLIRRFREIIAQTLHEEPDLDLKKVAIVMKLIDKIAESPDIFQTA